MSAESKLIDFKSLGESRLQVARDAASPEEWKSMWPQVPDCPISFGTCWKQFVQYSVVDLASEVGFYIDAFGFQPNAFGDEFVMFTNEERDFFFSVVPASETDRTNPSSINVSFMIQDIQEVFRTLQSRGVEVVENPEPQGNEHMLKGVVKSPNGISVELWEFIQASE